MADIVEKVENRTTPKISQMPIFWTTPPPGCAVKSQNGKQLPIRMPSVALPNRL
jgi:hypothetical protein